MSENDDTKQQSQTLTFEPLGYLANQSPTDESDEPQPLKNYANELITNIIKDASQTASRSHAENFDNANDLNFSSTSKQNETIDSQNNFDQSKYSTTNGYHNENDFDYEDIQNKMNGVIQDIQSQSTNDFHTTTPPPKSVASNHLHDEQINDSLPTNINSSSNEPSEGPVRSMSETALVDHHLTNEQSSPLPIRQDESQSDVDDFNVQTHVEQNDQRPTSASKQNGLDETAHFATTTSPRVQSAASKQSVRVTSDEQSTSGDEKRAELSPTKVLDEVDLANREVADIARRPSRTLSPLDRPRSPTPNDSRKASISNGVPTSYVPEQSPTLSDENQENKTSELPATIVSPASRRESASQNDEQQRNSRPTSAMQTKPDESAFEPATSRASSSRTFQFVTTPDQSKLITPGEKLQIPVDELESERINSPPPARTGIQSLALVNPLVETQQSQSPVPSDKNRNSPTASISSNEKVIDGDILSSRSRRESNISQQQINNTEQKSASRPGSQTTEQAPQISNSRRASSIGQQQNNFLSEQNPPSRRESTTLEQKPASRKGSTTVESQPPSKRPSNASEQHVPNRQESATIEQQPPSRKSSTASDQPVPSKRSSFVQEQQPSSRRESTTVEAKPASRKSSTASDQPVPSKRSCFVQEQQPSSRRESTTVEQKPESRRQSTHDEPQVSSKRSSFVQEQQPSSRRESTTVEQKPESRRQSTHDEPQVSSKRSSFVQEQQPSSRRESTTLEAKPASRKSSAASEQPVPSKRTSFVQEEQPSSRRESTTVEHKTHSRKESTASEQQPRSKRASIASEHEVTTQPESTYDGQRNGSRKASFNFDQQESNRRESPAPQQQSSHIRQRSFDQQDQKSPSKSASRKTSFVEQQESASRRQSQQQAASSRRTSTNQDNQPSSPPPTNNIPSTASRQSSRHNSMVKDEQQSSRRSSTNKNDTNHHQEHLESSMPYKHDTPQPISVKSQRERTPSYSKRQKSSSSVEENNQHHSPFQQRSGQESKRNSNLNIDQTVVTPIIMDSSKSRQQNGRRSFNADTSYDQSSPSKLPPVNSSFQQDKHRPTDSFSRADVKPLASSQATTSEDEQPKHWTTKVMIPSIHLSDDGDDDLTLREDQLRPQSPDVNQIAERNPALSPPLVVTTTTTVEKKTHATEKADEKKRKGRLSGRSTSVDSLTHIPLVDDKSLDSTSENNTDFDRNRRRHVKAKKRDVETNTEQLFDSPHQRQRSFFDEKELSLQKPLKATKSLSDHFYPTRRRVPNKDIVLTTPETNNETDTPTVRRTVKQVKDSNLEKDPVHVNVTVVVKKFASTSKDDPGQTVAETYVEQKPQPYFETVPRSTDNLPSARENKEKVEDVVERPKSIDQQQLKSPKANFNEQTDRHTQSDTEQIFTDEQKKRRRPKRISRTSQTYECVFRRMEREQREDLRATSDTEKNVQTKKSQLRPRKKSPKKNLPVYLSTDSFRLEELLPKQFHQSRRNMSKSSSVARSVSPQGGKLLILRPTLPFHHTDAVNVQRVCLQYAIDLIPNENYQPSSAPPHRNKLTVLKQPEQSNNLPMISASPSAVHISTNKSNNKEKSASYKSEDHTHQRKTGGAI